MSYVSSACSACCSCLPTCLVLAGNSFCIVISMWVMAIYSIYCSLAMWNFSCTCQDYAMFASADHCLLCLCCAALLCTAACRKMVEETEGSWGVVLIYLLTAVGE